MSLKLRTNLDRDDWAFIRGLCCLTGNAGDPIDPSRWPFFGTQWIGPYEKLRPEWAYLAEEDGRRLGYLTGAPDTVRFNFERRWLHDLPLFLKAKAGEFVANGDRDRFVARFLGRDQGPEDRFPKAATRDVLAEYPAHLHTNLSPEARGKGVGRLLVDRFREDLSQQGVRGIHLYCGPKPLAFYERVGFRILDQIEFKPGVVVYRLGSRIASG